ncbi:unnamed protein product [Urochloa humidicola]
MREYGAHSRVAVPSRDPEEESPAPPTRYLPFVRRGVQLASSVNILSISVPASKTGYPIDLYGNVFVRDALDGKRISVFRRDRDNSQRISSQDDLLSLTGPYRGLLVFDKIYFEFDLMCKDCGSGNDTELARWCVKDGTLASTYKPIRNSFEGELCSIDLTYAPAHRAVEVAFQFKICDIFTTREKSGKGWVPFNKMRKEHSEFHGNITISISGVHQDIVLYDSKAAGCVTGVDVDDGGLLKPSRHVFAVPIDLEVSLKIVPHDGCHFNFTTFPRISGGSSSENIVGPYNLEVKLVWSALFSPKEDGMPHGMHHYSAAEGCWGKCAS